MLRTFLALTLTVVLATLALIIATQPLNADEKYHSDGYQTRTAATGGLDNQGVLFRAWADYFGKLDKDASVDKVKGECTLVAFVAGGSNPTDFKKKFTLRRKFLGIIAIGDEFMKHHYDTTQWTGTNPYAYAQASGELGELTNKTEKWHSSQSGG